MSPHTLPGLQSTAWPSQTKLFSHITLCGSAAVACSVSLVGAPSSDYKDFADFFSIYMEGSSFVSLLSPSYASIF